jgi:hypothetical protein
MKKEKLKLKGRVHKYGANVDTDAIIPARYLNVSEAEELAQHCMEDIDEEFLRRMQPGDIIVATTPRWRSRRRAYRASSRRASPASSSATPSTSACRCWSARRQTRSMPGTIWRWSFRKGR